MRLTKHPMITDYVRSPACTYLDIVWRANQCQPIAAGVAGWMVDNGALPEPDVEQLNFRELVCCLPSARRTGFRGDVGLHGRGRGSETAW